eukprot:5993292-Lingulodinium_polyedra.AAC.1
MFCIKATATTWPSATRAPGARALAGRLRKTAWGSTGRRGQPTAPKAAGAAGRGGTQRPPPKILT